MKKTRDVSRLFTRRRAARDRIPEAIAAALVGAGIMYLADPDRGARRRALVRDKGMHAARRLGAVVDKASRDLAFRARGLAAEARSLADQQPVSDELVTERVRAKLGRLVSRPHGVHVEAHEGHVSLSGPVARDEVWGLLLGVRGVPGVHRVTDDLERVDPDMESEAREGERERATPRDQWSPITRVAMGAVAAGLFAHGVERRGKLGAITAGAGAALLLRDVANRPLRRVFGVGAGRRAVDFHKTMIIHAPIDEVYDLFTHVEGLPRFMSHLRSIEKLAGDRYRFVADGPLHLPVSWDADITLRVQNEVLAWRSVPSSVIANAGIARFERVDGGTRVDIRMSYNPPLGAIGHAFASLFGADPKHALDEDMARLKSLFERGKTSAHRRRVLAEDVGLRR